MKKAIIIAALALIVLFGGVWLIFSHKQTPIAGTSGAATSSPFGTPDSTAPAAEPGFEGEALPLGEPRPSGQEEGQDLKLFRLESSPVAGFAILSRGSTTVIRYADRATGNIFDVRLPDLEKSRLTNETLPQIYEAYFRPDGAAVLYRTLDESDTAKNMSLALAAPKASSSPEASEQFYKISVTLLRGELDGISVGAGDSLSYALKDAGTIVSSRFDGSATKTLWRGPLASWRTVRRGGGTAIFTKPSFSLPGYAYSLSSGRLAKLLGPLQGLAVAPSPSDAYLLYSYTNSNATRLFAEGQGGGSVELLPSTLADKCIGSAKEKGVFFCGAPAGGVYGAEPDSWYQGKTHFSDDIWRFDAVAQASELLLQPEAGFGVPLDVSLPQLSLDERYLVFVNRRDLSLWALSLK